MQSQIVNAHCPFDYALFKDAVCAIGVFDGVHLGHRFIINEAIEDAKRRGKRCVIVTFSVDPDELFKGENFQKLQTNAHRLNVLATLGANSVAVLPFDEEFSKLTPLQFLAKIFRKFTPCSIHVGSDFRFGAKAEGDVETLREWAQKNGCDVIAHDLLQIDGQKVSSTRIRNLLNEGNDAEANELLGVAGVRTNPANIKRKEKEN